MPYNLFIKQLFIIKLQLMFTTLVMVLLMFHCSLFVISEIT